MRAKSLSVVIPAFNEESRIVPTLRSVLDYLKKNFREFEIIVVDDGSSDGTAAVVTSIAVSEPKVRLIKNDLNMGKGYSVRMGVLAAACDLILMSDADLSTPIEELEKLLLHLHKGADIVIGSRGLKESEIAVRQPWYRERMGRTFNLIVRSFVLRGFKDTQCGFKLFRKVAAHNVFKRGVINGFGFDVEVLFVAKKMGYGIKEVPVKWYNSPRSTVSVLRDPVKMFMDVLRIRFNWVRGIYN